MKNGLKKSEKGVDGLEAGADLRAQIEARAYQLWRAGGSRHGEDLNHWLQAEREILERSPERRKVRQTF